MAPAAVVPPEASSLRNSCALMFYPNSAAFFDPGGRAMFNPVIPDTELAKAGSHRLYPYRVFAWLSLDLQDLLEMLIGPDPGTFREQFVVHEYPVNRRQSLPVTVDVKHSANVNSFHAVFMGRLCSEFARLTNQHIAIAILLADDPARLFRIARHHCAVHVLGVAFLF